MQVPGLRHSLICNTDNKIAFAMLTSFKPATSFVMGTKGKERKKKKNFPLHLSLACKLVITTLIKQFTHDSLVKRDSHVCCSCFSSQS